jgi:RND family efflux transporter MFP subunit
VVELPVRGGEEMAEGALIARLDDTPYRTILADRQAKYDLARTDFNRQKLLFEKKHVAQAKLDEARSNFQAAEAALKQARDNLGYTRLTTPYDGMVSRVDIDNFQNVEAGSPIVHFQGVGNVDVTFSVPESLFLSLNRDNTNDGHVQVRFDALPDRLFDALYQEHETLPDSATRSYEVTVSMPRPEGLTVLPGMSVTVLVDLSAALNPGGKPGVLVPVEAVFQEAGQTWVWTVDPEDRLRKTAVSDAGIEGEHIRVTEGLADGDRVIAAGVARMQDGQKVRPLVRERGL